ncbi:MAG: hypothetical protein A2Y41_09090 [Spirochaetes bacterium GWB1_36_13]|nr:MAG: hypothetical protein A2Y41_09090 [Spirochaetes bacterium GWB1_36_13]
MFFKIKKNKIKFLLPFIFLLIAGGSVFWADNTSAADQKDLVKYHGQVHNLFFHPLLVNTDKAFKRDRNFDFADNWFVTASEYSKILEKLYENNYILVNIHSVTRLVEKNGKQEMQFTPLMIPKGKKPLVITFDDVNYYEVQRARGTIHKLVIDTDGEIAGVEIDQNGKIIIAKNNNLVSITENFIRTHPDFSWQGARPVIGLTGYEGVFGYRTNELKSKTYSQDKADALAVAHKLKQLGWLFASHTYGHINVPGKTYQRLVQDTEKWKKEVEIFTGPTDLFIYPYGARLKTTQTQKLDYLKSQGFKVFFEIGNYTDSNVALDAYFIQRVAIDGRYLRGWMCNSKKSLYFSITSVIDLKRPKL